MLKAQNAGNGGKDGGGWLTGAALQGRSLRLSAAQAKAARRAFPRRGKTRAVVHSLASAPTYEPKTPKHPLVMTSLQKWRSLSPQTGCKTVAGDAFLRATIYQSSEVVLELN